MSVVGQARAGEQCTISGRDPTGAWLLADCGGAKGWVDRRLVTVNGSVDALPVTATDVGAQPPVNPLAPTPVTTPPPPPQTFQGWKVSYYSNPALSGSPVAYEDVPNLNFDFNWGYGSPNPAVPVDYFSARFERTLNFQAGYYRFNVSADDGVRLYIDSDLVINEWHEASGLQYSSARWLTGMHSLKLEYLELVGVASLRFSYEYSPNPPPWQATYYEGAAARGPQLYSQGEFAGSVQLQHTWGNNSPVPGAVPADNWNARWVGQFPFAAGNYIFRARSDDGVRVYLNDVQVINAWADGPQDRSNGFKSVGAGQHTITVDYYDRYGYAYIQVWWYPDQFGPNYVP
jgi:hypothetical protein